MVPSMNLLGIAVILGIVEGLTEFIPVSSTGHLILVSEYLGFSGEVEKTFNICIQLGAILAAFALYIDRFRDIFRSTDSPSTMSFSGRTGLLKITLACVPALAAGFLLHGTIKQYLFSPLAVAFGLIAGGIFFIYVETKHAMRLTCSVEEMSLKQALMIGLFQCCSLWPGVSRSGSTIAGAIFFGVDRRVAAEFSFIVAVPILSAAVGYDLLRSLGSIPSSMVSYFVVGTLVSGVVGALSIKALIALLGSYTLKPFGYYRIALGILIYYLYAT